MNDIVKSMKANCWPECKTMYECSDGYHIENKLEAQIHEAKVQFAAFLEDNGVDVKKQFDNVTQMADYLRQSPLLLDKINELAEAVSQIKAAYFKEEEV